MSRSPPVAMQRRRTKALPQEKKIADDEFMAAAIGDTEWLRQSLRGNRGTINFDKNGLSPIHLSAIHGRLDCLRLLVEKFKININLPSSTGWRPIHLCISNQTGKRSFNCLQYLLEHNADPSVVNDDGVTPMHQAASEGHVQCLKALIEVGATIDKSDHRGHKPIDLAKLWGHRKCARLLAAEQWHQDKDFLAVEMGKLQKMKMQQVLEDIQLDEEIRADQQFYGDLAFKEWLQNRELPLQATGPTGQDKGVLAHAGGGDRKEGKESLQKPKSLQLKQSGDGAEKSSDDVPKRVSRDSTSVSRSMGFTRESDGSSEVGLHENPEDNLGQLNDSMTYEEVKRSKSFWNEKDWNKSTKLPPSRFEYTACLPDHYPRDEFSMKPKHLPKRKMDQKSKVSHGTSDTKVKLPQDVIDKSLDPENYERPVVYKCKHIADIHKKKHYDNDSFPRPEAGLHLCQDPNAGLFQAALLPEKTCRTALSGTSDWGVNRPNYDLPNMMHMLQKMQKPAPFPGVKSNGANSGRLQCA